jgi:excisionase family DNA binding protein
MLTSRHGVIPLVLRPDEIAVLLGCSPWSVRRLIRQGDLRAVRIGRRYLVRIDDLVAFLEGNAVAHDVGLTVPKDLSETKPST